MDRRKTVLVLDFDDDLLISLERALEDSGFDTTTTWSVEEARCLMKEGAFDFLVLGNRPPALDAPALVADLRAAGGNFGCFVLGSDDRHDSHNNLLDRIRSFSCHPVLRRKAVREVEPADLSRRMGYGSALRKSEMFG